MSQFISDGKKICFISISAAVVLLFFVTFVPLRTQLKVQTIENYRLLAAQKQNAVHELIDHCLYDAESLFGGAAERELIDAYHAGRLTRDALYARTNPAYAAAACAIDDLTLAIRYVEDVPLLRYGAQTEDGSRYPALFARAKDTAYHCRQADSNAELIIYAPILDQNRLIAYDILVFDISQSMRMLEQDGFAVRILDGANPLLQQETPGMVYEKLPLAQEGRRYAAASRGGDYWVVVSKPASDVFSQVNRISALSLGLTLAFMTLFLGLVIMVYRLIHEIGRSREAYRNYANFDFLTGAHTRIFFDEWIKAEHEAGKKKHFVLAMVDVNCFKNINDNFGHRTGDEVLKFIAQVLMNTLRKNDFVIRFGGDEFIAVFQDVDAGDVYKIFDRVSQNIRDTNPFGFAISIAYGVEAVVSLDTIDDAVKKADEKMYAHKKECQFMYGLPEA